MVLTQSICQIWCWDLSVAKKGEDQIKIEYCFEIRSTVRNKRKVPKHVIDKAIDKGKGNTDETFTEGRYEGDGPNGFHVDRWYLDVKR